MSSSHHAREEVIHPENPKPAIPSEVNAVARVDDQTSRRRAEHAPERPLGLSSERPLRPAQPKSILKRAGLNLQSGTPLHPAEFVREEPHRHDETQKSDRAQQLTDLRLVFLPLKQKERPSARR
jgi:hypothetical protein